jgi:hypothetical protein
LADDDTPNEIVAAARDAKARRGTAHEGGKDKGNWSLKAIGLGVGIGSAAVAAALLYANRDRNGRDDG